MIPKKIHQIWVGDFKMPMREQALVQKMKDAHPQFEHHLWTEPDPDFPPNLRDWYDKFYAIKNYAFCADLLRLWVVWKRGGFYLDIDFDLVQPLDPFFENEGVFFYHNDMDHTIPNNIFAAAGGSHALEYCLSQVKPECSWYGPSWFGQTLKDYFGFPYEGPQQPLKEAMAARGILYHEYWEFEVKWARHLSLYSWSPEIWNRLNDGEQL